MTTSTDIPDVGDDPYVRLQASPEFQDLRRRFRRFVFPMTAFFLAWYFLYVLLAVLAPEFMGTRLGDSNITVGLLFGLGQFVTTFAITFLYARWAGREFDPAADALGERMERMYAAEPGDTQEDPR